MPEARFDFGDGVTIIPGHCVGLAQGCPSSSDSHLREQQKIITDLRFSSCRECKEITYQDLFQDL